MADQIQIQIQNEEARLKLMNDLRMQYNVTENVADITTVDEVKRYLGNHIARTSKVAVEALQDAIPTVAPHAVHKQTPLTSNKDTLVIYWTHVKKRTFIERLKVVEVVFSVGTTFEGNSLKDEIFCQGYERHVQIEQHVNEQHALHNCAFVITGLSRKGNITMAMIVPIAKEQEAQLLALHSILPELHTAPPQHFYKVGGLAAQFIEGSQEKGKIVIGAPDQGVVVHDIHEHGVDNPIRSRPGMFPCEKLRQAGHGFEAAGHLPPLQRPWTSGARFILEPAPTPYESEASCFIKALDQRGKFQVGNTIGLVGIITDTHRAGPDQPTYVECLRQLGIFLGYFVDNFHNL